MSTMKIDPKSVRLGDRIHCSDRQFREVDVIDHLGGGTFRFMFTDDLWIEYTPGKKVTVKVR